MRIDAAAWRSTRLAHRQQRSSVLCLVAMLAYVLDGSAAAMAQVVHLPQSNIRIEQMPQAGVRLPGLPLPPLGNSRNTAIKPQAGAPATPSAVKATAQVPRQTRHASHAGARPTMPDSVAPWPPLQLKLDTQLHLAAASAPYAEAVAPENAGEPGAPHWWDQLQAALAADEQEHSQAPLLDLLDAHAQAIRERADVALATRIGWALYRAQRFTDAARWFELALTKDTTAQSAHQGRFYALQKAGQLQAAFAAAEGDAALQAARADVAVQLALRARQQNAPQAVVSWLRQAIALGKDSADLRTLLAWSLLQAGDAAEAADAFARLYRDQPLDHDLAQGLYLSLEKSRQTARLQTLAAQPGALAELVRRQRALHWRDLGLARDAAELDPQADPALDGATGASIAIGAATRSKSGSAGTSQLLSRQTPALQLRWTNALGAWDAQIAAGQLSAGATHLRH